MSKLNISKANIDGVYIIEPNIISDKHTSAFTICDNSEFEANGISADFVTEEQISYPRGYLKGLHFQRENPQASLIRVVSGSALLVAVDMREDKESYGASCAIEISKENSRGVWVGEKFAIGILTLEHDTEIITKYTQQHAEKGGIIWSDPILNINWQFERYDIDAKYLNISKSDKKLPTFRSWDVTTLWLND
ncbi:MAG: dTDP-4-dehydrorhamnose 3,5-epimerase family protein [Rikenellaceae bacterium]